MNIAVMGGTFDPPHLGHTIPVEVAAAQFGLDRVYYIPAYLPPHKSREDLTDPFHRLAMLALALRPYPKFLVSTVELQKGRSVYTIETMSELRTQISAHDRLFFILGSDSFLEIRTWHRYKDLLEICELIIINRGLDKEELNLNLQQLERDLQSKLNQTIHFAASSFLPISSTEIRNSIRQGQTVSTMVSRDVEDYIYKHELYIRR